MLIENACSKERVQIIRIPIFRDTFTYIGRVLHRIGYFNIIARHIYVDLDL